MQRFLLKSKIHDAFVTDANLRYIGSITIDEDLLTKADLWPGERVQVVNNNTGARIETYVIKGKKGSGTICLNGAAAHHFRKGQQVIIMAYTLSSKPVRPKVILVDRKNRFTEYLVH